jgi:hypothetical protein
MKVTRQFDIISINQKRTSFTTCMDSVAEVPLQFDNPDEWARTGPPYATGCEARLLPT